MAELDLPTALTHEDVSTLGIGREPLNTETLRNANINVRIEDEERSGRPLGRISLWCSDLYYYRDHLEIAACAVYFLTITPAINIMVPLNKRSVPYQLLEISGDVVLDPSLLHDLREETIPEWLLVCIAIVPPLVFQVLRKARGDQFSFTGERRFLWLRVYFFALGTNALITNALKRYMGRLRPNFYAMCGFEKETLACNEEVEESRKSFPSGHSSVAFCAMTVMSLFLMNHVRRGETYKVPFAIISVSLPMATALFVAASRVRDNWHHPADVVAGSLIGFVCGCASHSLWSDTTLLHPAVETTNTSRNYHHFQG